jgi:molecular chaperone GrpE (heat shock protein)
MLDHVFALHQGALRSGQPDLIAQLAGFQNSCRDAARRVGLTPVLAGEAEPFDAQRHQLIDGDSTPATDAVIAETVAVGYTFQGKLVRPVLVRVRNGHPATSANPNLREAAPNGNQSQLPLEPAGALEAMRE